MPLDWIIGGPEYAGKGWMMLMGCLAAGRAISLPTSSTGGVKALTRFTGAYARVRSQFKTPIGKLEGVEEALGRIAANCYVMDATRVMTAGSVDLGEKPAVLSAIAKYHMTERARQSVNDAMPRPEQLGRPRLPDGADRHHRRGRQHPDAHPDHLRPGRDPLPSLRAARDARRQGDERRRGGARVRRRLHLAHRPRHRQRGAQLGSRHHQLAARADTTQRRARADALLPLQLAPGSRLRFPRRHVDAGHGRGAEAQGEDLRAPGRRAVDAVPHLLHPETCRWCAGRCAT